MKSAEEIMEILEAFDLTGSYRDAGELAGVSHHTVARYVTARDAGRLPACQGELRPVVHSKSASAGRDQERPR